MQKTILFLCTANYYRSRYSELLFNHYADEYGLNWKADSRGLLASLHNNPGPIYDVVTNRLEGIGAGMEKDHRYPIQLQETDLEKADLTIALKQAEHHSMMRQLFPEWAEKITYWHIHDIDVEPPEIALPKIDIEICKLIEDLSAAIKPFL
jgi:protein-tyrosine phosphatase